MVYSGVFQKQYDYDVYGPLTTYREVSQYGHGPCKVYVDEACNHLIHSGEYYNGLKTGKWIEYNYDTDYPANNGKPYRETLYDKGVVVSERYLSPRKKE